jgi:hypothetical protein
MSEENAHIPRSYDDGDSVASSSSEASLLEGPSSLSFRQLPPPSPQQQPQQTAQPVAPQAWSLDEEPPQVTCRTLHPTKQVSGKALEDVNAHGTKDTVGNTVEGSCVCLWDAI